MTDDTLTCQGRSPVSCFRHERSAAARPRPSPPHVGDASSATRNARPRRSSGSPLRQYLAHDVGSLGVASAAVAYRGAHQLECCWVDAEP